MKKLFLLIIAIMCSSCAPQYTWNHPYASSPFQFNIDRAECDIYAQEEKMKAYYLFQGNPMLPLIMVETYDRAFENCMHLKGWYKTEERR